VQAEVSQHRRQRPQECFRTRHRDRVHDAWREAGIQEKFQRRGIGEEAQVVNVEEARGPVLPVALEQIGNDAVMLHVGHTGERNSTRAQQTAMS
jgi:hypothetical protein